MNSKKLIAVLGATTISALGLTVVAHSSLSSFNVFALKRSVNNHSVISYHLADDASKGEVTGSAYQVRDGDYFYTGFVSAGTFSSNGLALNAGEFFQADLKGGSSVQIAFTSGEFAIELSNDNTNFSSGKYLSSQGTYSFHTLMRYIRVLCKSNGVLTDVNIGCECSEDYTYNTTAAMDESVWTNTVKQNRLTLVGRQRGSVMHELNYHNIVGARDGNGVYFFVTEKIFDSFYSSNGGNKGHWWGKDNFEIQFNSTGVWGSTHQLYASLEPTDVGNFDIVKTATHGKYHGYDSFVTATFKCYASYETLSAIAGSTYNSSSDIYLWYGSRSTDSLFDCVSFWESNSQVKLTTNGIVDTVGNLYGTIQNREGDWGNTANWYEVTDDLTTSGRKTVAAHVEGAQNRNKDNWSDYCWAAPLSILPVKGDLGKRTVFRLDWYGWDDGYTPTSRNNGGSWAPEVDKATNGNTRYYEAVIDCEMIFVFRFNPENNMYTSLRFIIPNNPDVVTRGDFYMYQEVTTTETLGAYINSEFTNSILYK